MKKPLYFAGVSGIIVLILSVFSGIFGQLIYNFSSEVVLIYSLVLWIVMTFFSIIFNLGFLFLAKKYKAKLLLVMTWISIIITLILFILMMVSNILYSVPGVNAQAEIFDFSDFEDGSMFTETESGEISDENIFLMIGLLVLWVIFSILYGAFSILFGIGLMKLKNDVRLSRASGILHIISGATMIIFVGAFIAIAVMIVETVMFFKASKELESEKIVSKE
ncbi:hypothetical protein GOV12_08015 [Candidatus Pacearchaeota archaeon]|nr:hypothetical protein [Candidatus Pacearchaeota archaeon]